jgi:predicted O-methyltransferase YrrM
MAYPAVGARLEAARPAILATLAAAEALAGALAAMAGPPPAPRLDQDWFPRLDAAAAYALVRTRRPTRIVEIGSGHSTRFLARAVADAGAATRLTCIDPAPRASLAGLALTHLACTLDAAPEVLLAALGPGDVLFVDSSHVAMPGTDVDLVFNAILPRLPAGVLVHLHDTFLPDPYPEAWAWRGYGEQMLTALAITSGRLVPLFASHFVVTRLAAHLAASPLARLPLVDGAHESSFWGTTA